MGPARQGRSAHGFTLLEVIVALALTAVATAGVLGCRPPAAARAAEEARAFLLWARLEAMWSGRAVAVVPAAAPGLEARGGSGAAAVEACAAPVLRGLLLRRYGRVSVVQDFRDGIVWLPGGGARTCDGGGVISGRMVVADGSRTAHVVVSSLGRVRVEVEP